MVPETTLARKLVEVKEKALAERVKNPGPDASAEIGSDNKRRIFS